MLTFYGSDARGVIPCDISGTELPPQANWIDAFNPTAEELAFLERTLGTRIPTLADLEEIETSSRLAVEGDNIVMSLPATVKDATGFPHTSPIGFVLLKERVLTVRFERLPSFESLTKRLTEKGAIARGGLGATVTILEIIIDHIADVLERIGGDLDGISRRVFATDMIASKARRPRQTNHTLRVFLQTIGRSGDLASKMSETLLGLNRMVPYIVTHAAAYMTPDCKARLDVMGQDTKSLNDYDDHLTNKTQFLLDTLLGIANIEQNNVFRVLTVVSVVGIPPTFFASMWGMNFKTMPELDWPHGYTMGLSVIAVSAILPAIWFKVRGWW
jgi:magnesium transporter